MKKTSLWVRKTNIENDVKKLETVIEIDGEFCCPLCKMPLFDVVDWIKIFDIEYPVYYCPDCDEYFVAP